MNKTFNERVARVLDAFGLVPARHITRLGGTASEVALANGDDGPVLVRWRAGEFNGEDYVRFDHACLVRLAGAGLPVPVPYTTPGGATSVRDDGSTVEVLTWLCGEPFQEGDDSSVADLGRTLARFHTALADDPPAGKENFVREDHPDLVQPYVAELAALCRSDQQRRDVGKIESQLERIRDELDSGLYDQLPHTIIHGDIHPGNVAFRNSQVSALFDFDYMSRQARARDLCDALMFFAASRELPLNPGDIQLLTQPYCLQMAPSRLLIDGYQQVSRLTDLDWQGLTLLLRSQWCQIRLRGSRKVPENSQLEFVLSGFMEMIDRLDQWEDSFLQELRR